MKISIFALLIIIISFFIIVTSLRSFPVNVDVNGPIGSTGSTGVNIIGSTGSTGVNK